MPARFLVVPQWQGSGSARAMRLVDGAEAIRGDLPAALTTVVDVPLEAGDAQGSGILRLSSLQLVRERLAEALARTEGAAIVVGGDCGVEWAAVERFAHEDVALVWFDAHADLESPETSPSGAFSGMVLRRLLDEGFPAKRVVLAGARALGPGEERFLTSVPLRTLAVGELQDDAAALASAVAATGARTVYVHVDLDVLDPAELEGVDSPEPFGLTATALVSLVRTLVSGRPLAGAGVTGFAPASPDAAVQDLPTILRLVGALTRP